MNLRTRLAKLETANDRGRLVVIYQHHDETEDQASARWRAKHPGEDPFKASLRDMLIRWSDPTPT